jgi:nucleotide-binding universal stress UspA family protein
MGRDQQPIPLFARLLVPLDLTGDSKAALNTALVIAHATHAEITLLHVVPEVERAPRHAYPAFYKALESSAEKKLGAIAKRFWKKHLRVREEIRVGDPLAEILGCAKKAEADLIVLRSHRFAANKPGRGWGTVSYKVASHCDCPVLLAK